MQALGVKGVHIAERDTQAGRDAKPLGSFVNTWSVEGFVSESFQPAELGWGSHERWFPPNGHRHDKGCKAAIYLDTPGILTKVHTWTPEAGPQYGFLVTHNEAISIADYYTVGEGDAPEFRPTCHYAYHPCDQAVLSPARDARHRGKVQETLQDPRRERDPLGRGLPRRPALRPREERALVRLAAVDPGDPRARAVPERHRPAGDERGPRRHGLGAREPATPASSRPRRWTTPSASTIQRPYLGRIEAHYTDWTPISTRWPQFAEEIDESDPWQFQNVLAT